MTPDEIAEAFERARYEQLRGNLWADLRDGERQARVGMARQAIDDSGIAAHVTALAARSAEADGLAALLAQRDAELARRIAEHDQEVARLTAEVAQVRAELDATLVRADATEAVRDRLAAVVAAVRTVVEAAEAPAGGTADDAAADEVTQPAGEDTSDDGTADHVAPTAPQEPAALAEVRPARKGRFGRSRSSERVPG